MLGLMSVFAAAFTHKPLTLTYSGLPGSKQHVFPSEMCLLQKKLMSTPCNENRNGLKPLKSKRDVNVVLIHFHRWVLPGAWCYL